MNGPKSNIDSYVPALSQEQGITLKNAIGTVATSTLKTTELNVVKCCMVCGEGVNIPISSSYSSLMCDKCKQAIMEMRRKMEC